MDKLLEVRDLAITRPSLTGVEAIVRDISLRVESRQVLGVVGESGSGKSITALALLGLIRPPLATSGQLLLGGVPYDLADQVGLASVRGRDIGMIFQDPRAALNPVRTIGAHFRETLRYHDRARRSDVTRQVVSLLKSVGIGDPERRLGQYPHQLSGGLCQRVMIALALVAKPKVLIADEPTTALDTTVQAQVLDLIDEIRRKEGMAVIFISHDIAVIGDICDRVAVFRNGAVVETGECDDVFRSPATEYARTLITVASSLDDAVPVAR